MDETRGLCQRSFGIAVLLAIGNALALSCFSSKAATFATEAVDPEAKRLAVDAIEKYPTKTIHGIEYIVIDDMLFRRADVVAKGAFSGDRWPGGVLVISYDTLVTPTERNQFNAACIQWGQAANVSCKERTNEKSFVNVYSGDVNQSVIGCCAGSLTLADWGEQGVVEHEMAHAFGMIHEQSRSDRDQYVYINFANVLPGQGHNFDKVGGSDNYTPYDYQSIMHYSSCEFSINKDCAVVPGEQNDAHEKKTIVPVQCNIDLELEMGNRTAATSFDLQAMAIRYGVSLPLNIFHVGRAESCGVQRMTLAEKIAICDKAHENCGAKAQSPVLSQTEEHGDDWCDDSFQGNAGCPANKPMFNFSEREGAACGLLQINHIHHRRWECSCAAYNAWAACRNGDSGIDESLVNTYSKSKEKREHAIGAFVSVLLDGVKRSLVVPEARSRLQNIVLTHWGTKSYPRKMRSASKRLARKLRKLNEDNKKGQHPLMLSYDDVASTIH